MSVENQHSLPPYRPCAACGGTGRVAVGDLADLAAEVWERNKNARRPSSSNSDYYAQIVSIKELRSLTGMGLRECKDLIDAAANDPSPTHPGAGQ